LLEFYAGDRNGAKGGRGGSGGAAATRGRSGVRTGTRDSGEQGAFDADSSGGKGVALVQVYSFKVLCVTIFLIPER
jgi:hypothetical protein